MAVLGKIGRSMSNIGSRKGLIAIGGAAFGAGFINKISESAVNNTMDVAFGTPDADNMMLGGMDLTPSMAMGALAPGAFGSIGRAMNPVTYGVFRR